MLIGETPIGTPPAIGDSYLVNTISYGMDQWIIFTGSEPLEEPPGAIRYWYPRSSDILLKKTVGKTYDFGFASCSSNNYKHMQMNISLLKALRDIEMGITLVPAYELTIPSTSVLNALVWSWAEVLDSVWRQMEQMTLALKIESASGTDLDNAWGEIFDIPRIYQEDDTSYRYRLKTRTLVLTSSGTKDNCEKIVNNIIGESATNFNTRYPASVDITFNTISAMRKARDNINLLNMLIPQMLASGISYNMYLPFMDYYMDCYMKGPLTLSYNIVTALKHKNTNSPYNMDIIDVFINDINYDIDVLMNIEYEILYGMYNVVQKSGEKSYVCDAELFKTVYKDILCDLVINRKNILTQTLIDTVLEKYDIGKSWSMDTVSKISLRRFLRMRTNLVFQNITQFDSDIIIRLYAARINMDILTKRAFPRRYGMVITLVGA